MAVARRRRTPKSLAVAALIAALGACSGHGVPVPAPAPDAGAQVDATPAPVPAPPETITKRTRLAPARVDSAALERQVTARFAAGPLAEAMARRTHRPEVADRAAIAVVREADQLRMSPTLLAAVLLVENRGLDTAAVSSQGAVGLMQVMPMHAGSYGCASVDLRELDANICHGARLLHMYLARSSSVRSALRRYNGCVRGTNTPSCHRYAPKVLHLASALRRDMLLRARGELAVASATPAVPGGR